MPPRPAGRRSTRGTTSPTTCRSSKRSTCSRGRRRPAVRPRRPAASSRPPPRSGVSEGGPVAAYEERWQTSARAQRPTRMRSAQGERSASELTVDEAVALVSRSRGPRLRPPTGWPSLTPHRASGGRARRRRTVQPGHRRPSLHQSQHGQDAPQPRVHQARRLQSRRSWHRPTPASRRGDVSHGQPAPQSRASIMAREMNSPYRAAAPAPSDDDQLVELRCAVGPQHVGDIDDGPGRGGAAGVDEASSVVGHAAQPVGVHLVGGARSPRGRWWPRHVSTEVSAPRAASPRR